MYKENMAVNNLQWLICHKSQPNLLFLFYKVKKRKQKLKN